MEWGRWAFPLGLLREEGTELLGPAPRAQVPFLIPNHLPGLLPPNTSWWGQGFDTGTREWEQLGPWHCGEEGVWISGDGDGPHNPQVLSWHLLSTVGIKEEEGALPVGSGSSGPSGRVPVTVETVMREARAEQTQGLCAAHAGKPGEDRSPAGGKL